LRLGFTRHRGVAQSGSAFGWGPKGRWFKSSRPDLFRITLPEQRASPASPVVAGAIQIGCLECCFAWKAAIRAKLP
jgi:hypothetical protein